MSLSKIVVSGKVTKAPEKRFTPSTNVAVTEFFIAVESPPRQDGSSETQTVKVITWRDLAERLANEVKKGDLVVVDGRLQINNFTNQEGQRRRDVEIDAVAVENLSSGQSLGDEGRLVRTGAKAPSKAAPNAAAQGEDLDAIFASEDEIPF